VTTAINDLRLGLAEYNALKAGKDKTFARKIVGVILWENLNEILTALETVERLSKPRS
jgi:hypothetical protein